MRPIALDRDRKQRAASLCAAAAFIVSCLVPSVADARSFIWKASSQNGVVYLVGSVHLLSSDYYPLNPSLDAAFKDSSMLVEEVDLAEMLSLDAQLHMVTRGMLPGGQTIDAVVTPSTLALVNKALANLGSGPAGLPVDQLRQFKPWMLALTLLEVEWQRAGFDANLGLDKHFFNQAKRDGKPVQGLETLDYQINRFDEMPMASQDRLLAESLNDSELADVKILANAWKDGDEPAVEHIVLDDLKQDAVLYQRLLVERNRNWLPKIEALFGRPTHAFVVVGAAHLVGPDGLLALLRARGYKVEQL